MNFDSVSLLIDGKEAGTGLYDSVRKDGDLTLDVAWMATDSSLVPIINDAKTITYKLSGPNGKVEDIFSIQQINDIRSLFDYWISGHS
jgi:hypothetical protein